MTKLTDPNYKLPFVEALSAFDLLIGTTAPLAVWGVDTTTSERGQYVVKFNNHDRMTITSSAFELIGSWMAMQLELPVVEPAIVNLSPAFIETMKGRDGYRAALQSQGINFGSRYQEGLLNIPDVSFSIPKNLEETAKLIFVFDMFIANTDRGHQRPNVVFNNSNLLIFDHELAFSFLRILPFLRNKTPWILNEADRDLYEKHFFYKFLKDLKPDLTQQVNLLKCFNEDFWSKVYETLPKEWIDDKVLEIQPYLTTIVENLPYFAESLNKTLAL
jgi:hypothetical protein